ncbi:MAG: hypothetical protein ABFD97_18395 [Syntrophobacter sp.]
MRRLIPMLVCVILLGIFGCTHTELTRRYHSKDFGDAPKQYVQVSAFVIEPPSSPPKTLVSQLTPEGQRGFFTAVGAKAKDLAEVKQALLYTGKKEGEQEVNIDKTVFQKRVVFSVEKKYPPGPGKDDPSPADRINELKISLNLPDKEGTGTATKGNSPIFAEMDRLTTKYGTVNLGELSRNQTTTASMAMTIGAPAQSPVPVSVSPSVSNEESISEKINLQQRYIEMSGAIRENNHLAVLVQESPVGYDLTGNFTVDFVIRLKNHGQSHIVDIGELEKDSKPLSARDVEVAFGSLFHPTSSNPIDCDLTSEFTIRHVSSPHDRELAEGPHRVTYWRGKTEKEFFNLVDANELRTKIYKVVLKPSSMAEQELFLGSPAQDGLDEHGQPIYKNPLWFAKFEKAQMLVRWLKQTKSTSVGRHDIYTRNRQFSKRDIRDLEIKPVGLTDR